MNCARGHYIPENRLACPVCAEENGRRAAHVVQLEMLRKVVAREWGYKLQVVQGSQHVLQFASPRAFCGAEVHTRKTDAVIYSEELMAKVCAGCRLAIEDAIEEFTE